MLRKRKVKHTARRPRRPLKGRTQRIDGIPVVNAKGRLSLTITDTDIARAKRKAPAGCAAAVAVKRQIEGCTDARVHSRVIYVRRVRGDKEVYERFATPPSLRLEALTFDRGGEMQPDIYELRPARTRIGQRQGSSAPGARDAGSTDRTPSFTRKPHYPANVRPMARAREGEA